MPKKFKKPWEIIAELYPSMAPFMRATEFDDPFFTIDYFRKQTPDWGEIEKGLSQPVKFFEIPYHPKKEQELKFDEEDEEFQNRKAEEAKKKKEKAALGRYFEMVLREGRKKQAAELAELERQNMGGGEVE